MKGEDTEVYCTPSVAKGRKRRINSSASANSRLNERRKKKKEEGGRKKPE